MMAQKSMERQLREELAELTETCADDWFLVYKARFGMEAAFSALRSVRGAGSVVTQLFTCCTAVDPIVAAGLSPVYRDVSDHSLALDPARLELPADARAVMLQNTFGIIDTPSARLLCERAHEAGALLVEDCAHCAGRMARDAQGEPLADVSVHSFGVEKMLPTYFGGAVWVSPRMADTGLRASIIFALDGLPALDARRERAARLYPYAIRVLNHLPRAVSRPVRGLLEGLGLFEPAIAEEELRAGLSGSAARPGEWVAERALEALRAQDEQLSQRAAAVRAYDRAFAAAEEAGVPVGTVEWMAGSEAQPLLVYPVLLGGTERADRAVAAVRELGFYSRAWYRPLLFPGVLDKASYQVPDRGSLPLTRRWSERVAALPTDVSTEDAARIAAAVRRVAGE